MGYHYIFGLLLYPWITAISLDYKSCRVPQFVLFCLLCFNFSNASANKIDSNLQNWYWNLTRRGVLISFKSRKCSLLVHVASRRITRICEQANFLFFFKPTSLSSGNEPSSILPHGIVSIYLLFVLKKKAAALQSHHVNRYALILERCPSWGCL